MKPVKSTDPRKAAIVYLLKMRSACTKVTNVKEADTHFEGDCLWPLGGRGYVRWEKRGTYQVNKDEVEWAMTR